MSTSTSDLLREALQFVQSQGYVVTFDWLDGVGSDAVVRMGDRAWLIMDHQWNEREQLEYLMRRCATEFRRAAGRVSPALQQRIRGSLVQRAA